MDKTKLIRYMATTAYTPALSMDSKGRFSLNMAAVEHYKLKDFKFVAMYHTTEFGGAVVMEFTNEPNVGVLKLSPVRNSSVRFASSDYAAKFKVAPFRSKRVVPEPDSKYIYAIYGG